MDVLKDLGIRGRVLMLTLLPSTLLAVVLGAYFTWMQLSEMRHQLDERGQLIAEQLAPLAAPAMNLGYDKRLQRILTQVLDQADVRAVTILDPERVQRVHAGPRMLTPPPPGDPEGLTRVSSMDHTRILMPVLSRHLNLADEARGPEEKLIGWLELELSHHNTLLRGYRSLLTSLFLVGAGLIITALLALRMSRAISLPLQRVKAAVAQLKDGHLETRLPPLGSHEMDELASGINRMAEALLSAREELQQSIDQATEDVQQNLETIEIQNIELDLARKEALEASRIKSEFLANMSHEIRTPLNGILGFTQLLQKSDLTPRQQDYLGTIEKSADSLLGIINEILDFSKIEAGKLVLDTIPFNLRDLIEDTLTILAPAAHTKQLELVSLVYRDTPLSLVGDPLRLKQVLTNLISNAIKFTNEGTIAVRAMVEDDNAERAQLRISVQDTGIGLTDQDLRALFQAFSQADNSMSRQPGGTGLGLVISKRLIEQMGGEIGVDSIPDEGSEFWISLSLPKDRDDAEDLPHPALQGRRIALLEQHPLARQALQHQLHSLGLEVQTFDTLDQMQSTISVRRQSSELIDLAVLGVTNREIEPQALSRRLAEIEALGCKCVVLCPTTEQASYHDALPEAHSYTQLQGKPACTRKLQRVLVELVRPNQAYAEPAAAAPSRAQPRRPGALRRRQSGQPPAGQDSARRHGCRRGGGGQRPCRAGGGQATQLRSGIDGRADAGHGRSPDHRSHSPMGAGQQHAAADRRVDRPCPGQREALAAAERPRRLPDQAHQRSPAGAGRAQVDRPGPAQSAAAHRRGIANSGAEPQGARSRGRSAPGRGQGRPRRRHARHAAAVAGRRSPHDPRGATGR